MFGSFIEPFNYPFRHIPACDKTHEQ